MKKLIVVWVVLVIIMFSWRESNSGLNADVSYFDRLRASCIEKHGEDDVRVSACVDSEYLETDYRNNKIYDNLFLVLIIISPIGFFILWIKEHKKKNGLEKA